MKTLTVLLSIAVCAASSSAYAASTTVSSSTTRNAPEPEAKVLKASDAQPTGASKSRIFPVNDERGLLLTCIAPEIATNPDTDRFEDCTLAPGRNLNEVIHSFVGAMHTEQKEHEQERTRWEKALDEKRGQTATSK